MSDLKTAAACKAYKTNPNPERLTAHVLWDQLRAGSKVEWTPEQRKEANSGIVLRDRQ